jgi:prepilin-type N-terminal cleavage/methylation domain-containing protein
MAFRTHTPRRRAFSLVEVLVSLTIIGLAGAALLLAAETTTLNGQDAVAATIARGIAEQLLDDLAGQRYVALGKSPTGLPFAKETGETSTPPKTSLFDDLDDYHQLDLAPPLDPWGVPLGQGNGSGGLRPEDFRVSPTFFARWRARVEVTYVNEADPSVNLAGSATSGMRAATVSITRTVNGVTETLAQVRRVFSYVPPAPSS